MKNLKAALLSGQVITLSSDAVERYNLPCNAVTAEHIKALVMFQEGSDLKLAPKLTNASLNPSHFDKMKVSQALNFFSHSTSAALRYLVKCEGYSKEFLTTAWFFDHVNRWFDLMSSRHPIMTLSKLNDQAYNSALTHLKSTIDIFQTLSIGVKGMWKPVQTGVVLSTTSILYLQAELLNNGHAFLRISRLMQDCLENLFSCTQTRNPVPTAYEFKQSLKIVSVAQYLVHINE